MLLIRERTADSLRPCGKARELRGSRCTFEDGEQPVVILPARHQIKSLLRQLLMHLHLVEPRHDSQLLLVRRDAARQRGLPIRSSQHLGDTPDRLRLGRFQEIGQKILEMSPERIRSGFSQRPGHMPNQIDVPQPEPQKRVRDVIPSTLFGQEPGIEDVLDLA